MAQLLVCWTSVPSFLSLSSPVSYCVSLSCSLSALSHSVCRFIYACLYVPVCAWFARPPSPFFQLNVRGFWLVDATTPALSLLHIDGFWPVSARAFPTQHQSFPCLGGTGAVCYPVCSVVFLLRVFICPWMLLFSCTSPFFPKTLFLVESDRKVIMCDVVTLSWNSVSGFPSHKTSVYSQLLSSLHHDTYTVHLYTKYWSLMLKSLSASFNSSLLFPDVK